MRTAQLLIGSWAALYACLAFMLWDIAWIADVDEWRPLDRFGLAYLAVCGSVLMLVVKGLLRK